MDKFGSSLPFDISPSLQVGDALIAINGVPVKELTFAEIMSSMKTNLREGQFMLLRFRTMEERYRLLRMKVMRISSSVIPSCFST